MLLLVCVAPARATQPHHPRRYPSWWFAQARCIHHFEADVSSRSYRQSWTYRPSWRLTTVYGTSEPSGNRGGFQISTQTWATFAPHGYPNDPAAASRPQQVRVAHAIWTANGHRWGGQQWPGTAATCGVQ